MLNLGKQCRGMNEVCHIIIWIRIAVTTLKSRVIHVWFETACIINKIKRDLPVR